MWDKVVDIEKCHLQANPSNEIRNIGKDLLINPKEIFINPYSSTSENIESTFIKTNDKNKMNKCNR